MSRIDELIKEHCPDGARSTLLGDLVKNFDRLRKPVTRSNRETGPYPYYGANGVQDFVQDYLFDGTYLLLGEDGSVQNQDGTPVLHWAKGKIWVNNHAHVLQAASDDVELRYLFYYLQTVDISAYVTGSAQPKLNQRNMNAIPVVVPPSEVQRAIVDVLDKFTKLEAELEAELEARKKQYAHFRHVLMFERQDTRTVSLGDIATIGTGSHDTKDAMPEGEYTFYARGRVPLKLDTFDFDEDAIITAGDGVGVGKVFHFASGKYALHQRAYRIVPDESVEARYIYHYLVADFSRYVERTSVHASVTSLRRPMLLNYELKLPTVDRQRQTVSILDKFDALVNDPSSGLPAEIAARRKQYEYYRDQLMTFKELAS